jgi:hypothetical protein
VPYNFTISNSAVTITAYTGSGGAVVIPDTIYNLPVTSIGGGSLLGVGGGAFSGCINLTSVTIPNSVTNIGDQAFSYCTNLTNVAIGNGVTIIGWFAFSECFSLRSITIPNNVTSIGLCAFSKCSNLTSVTIGNGVTGIGEDAFEHCGNLTNVTIGNAVTIIAPNVFAYCHALTSVHFMGNAPIFITNDLSVFSSDTNATVYYLPWTTGWGTNFDGRPTVLWLPQVQTSDATFGMKTNQFGFNINWVSDQTVVVEACADLANPVWSPVGTNTLTGGTSYFTDSQWTNYPSRFYRIRSP